MMPLRQLKLTELGRHLPNQGPLTTSAMVVGKGPRLDCSRGPSDKSATEEKTKKKNNRIKNVGPKNSLNILQWNAEGLGPHKVLELRKLMKENKTHFALLQ